ncbi:MAG: pirin family protein, partial [Myxococcota bacterium]
QLVRVDPLPSGVLRPFPSPALSHLDPFVFLDTGAPLRLGTRDIYVGPHAHRGVQPVSLLFRGRIEHRDSLGHHATVTSGGMQWLVAGSGALHEEVLYGDDDGVFHMAQLWVDLPAARKWTAPEHHAVPSSAVPVLHGQGTRVRLYAGTLGDQEGPAPLGTPVRIAHVALDAAATLRLPAEPGWTVAVTSVAGTIGIGEASLGPGATAVFADDGTAIELHGTVGGEALVLMGQPIGQAIVTGAGFVMNTAAEIDEAFADEAAGRMGVLTPSR